MLTRVTFPGIVNDWEYLRFRLCDPNENMHGFCTCDMCDVHGDNVLARNKKLFGKTV